MSVHCVFVAEELVTNGESVITTTMSFSEYAFNSGHDSAPSEPTIHDDHFHLSEIVNRQNSDLKSKV